jgi:lysophospholipase L1-like esterase
MNNPVVLSFGDGTAFFVGVAAVVTALLLLVRYRRRLAAALLIAVVLLGIVIAICSATPLPAWAYAVWLCAVTATLVLCLWRPMRKARIASAGVLLATSIGICAAETPYHLFPRLSVGPHETIYVVGDSLSAGTDKDLLGHPCPKLRCWPAVLGDLTQLAVVNLAEPGAKVQHALAQAKLAKQTDAVVIIEIGGNDFFDDVATFRRQLDALVSSLHGHRAILMFELPLFPFQNAFGQAQREVAAKYRVILIPKRCLTAVWGSSGATLDGLHFSQTGHNVMARMVANVLKIEDAASPRKD